MTVINKRILLVGFLFSAVSIAGIYAIVLLNSSHRPDSLNLITLLHNKKYEKLNTLLSKRATAYETDITKEINFSIAIDALANADPKHEVLMTEWIEKQPDNYLPYLVRGIYFGDLGYTWRSTDASRNTSGEQFDKMTFYHKKAYLDLEKSIQLKPTSVAYSTLIDLSSSGRDGKSREEVLEVGLALMPESYVIRKSALFKLMPRWGGSFEEIDAFLEDTRQYLEINSALKPLLGFKDYVIGYNLQSRGQYNEALAQYTKALSFGDKDWYLQQRGTTYLQLEDYENTLADHDRALELFPHFQLALTWRGITYAEMKKYDNALEDFNLASQLEPYDFLVHKNRGNLYRELNQYENAVKDYKTSLFYEKHHGDVWHVMGWVLNYKLKNYKEAAKAYKFAAIERPNNPDYWYEYAISLNNLLDCEVVPVLDKYLSVCQSENHEICGDKYQIWANQVIESLVSNKRCPAL